MKRFVSGHRTLVLLAVLVLIAAAAGLAMTVRPFGGVQQLSQAAGVPREAGTAGDARTAGVEEPTLTALDLGARGVACLHGRGPREWRLVKSARSFDGDLRDLPYVPPVRKERPELESPEAHAAPYGSPTERSPSSTSRSSARAPAAPAPAPIMNFDGLDLATWGTSSGHSPLGSVGKSG